MKCCELIDLIVKEYDLEDAVADRLVIQFKTFVGNQGNTKNVTIPDGDEVLSGRIRFDKKFGNSKSCVEA